MIRRCHFVSLIGALLLLTASGASIQDAAVAEPQDNTAVVEITANNPPLPPTRPTGPAYGEHTALYVFTTVTVDPDGDQVQYGFDWGDGSSLEWTAPFPSNVAINASHGWHHQGRYLVRVMAMDSQGAKSDWSSALEIIISGPYLTASSRPGGTGLHVDVENIGDRAASSIVLTMTVSGGRWVVPRNQTITISSLDPTQTQTVRFPLLGVGVGLAAPLPSLTLTMSAPHCRPREKQLSAVLLGPLVLVTKEHWSIAEASPGYTLYSPMVSPDTFLIDTTGQVVHEWTGTYKPALATYLLPDGSLLRTALATVNQRFFGGGMGGRVERFDWNGSLLWSFDYSTLDYCLHHDVYPMPSGTILMIAWEYKSADEAIAAGRDPTTLQAEELWPDHLIEVRPTDGSIVWEWHVWDHLIQDYDPSKANYGAVADHPELVDVNFGGRIMADWTHTNAVDYHEGFDQILISVLGFSEIWVIDHSTTTQEAAGHTGGRYGHGGDLLYRWGNPAAYRAGSSVDQQLFWQHGARWIDEALPGAGNILIFNNGLGRPGDDYSSLEEITPPVDLHGFYSREPGSAFGPLAPTWQYTASDPAGFFAVNLGSVQRLQNGNTLACDGPHGRFFEVTREGEVIWEYQNTVPTPFDSHVFMAVRYPPDYPGLSLLCP